MLKNTYDTLRYIFWEIMIDKDEKLRYAEMDIFEYKERLKIAQSQIDMLEREIEHLRSGCDERIKKLQEENEMLEEEVLKGEIKQLQK